MTKAEVKIPERLEQRPKYKGFPIPYISLVVDGVPDFKVTEMTRWEEVVIKERCALCGERLSYYMFFIGGHKSLRYRLFHDPAMHEECAKYSIEVCPFLLGNKEYAEHQKDHSKTHAQTTNPNVSTDPLDQVALIKTRGYKLVNKKGRAYIKCGSVLDVEWFDRKA